MHPRSTEEKHVEKNDCLPLQRHIRNIICSVYNPQINANHIVESTVDEYERPPSRRHEENTYEVELIEFE